MVLVILEYVEVDGSIALVCVTCVEDFLDKVDLLDDVT
jgi:hypothetical protein